MKEVINLQGQLEQVSIETPVKTIDGVHYLLTSEEQAEIDQRTINDLPRQIGEAVDKFRRDLTAGTVTSNGAEFKCDNATLGALASLVVMFDKLGQNAPATVAWKAENGFFNLTPAQVNQAGLAVVNRRQKVFSSAKTVQDEVEAGTITTVQGCKDRFTELMGGL